MPHFVVGNKKVSRTGKEGPCLRTTILLWALIALAKIRMREHHFVALIAEEKVMASTEGWSKVFTVVNCSFEHVLA